MQYSDEYNALLDKLCRSFSRQQLRAFTILYKLDLRAIRAKIEYAEAIIEKQWGWPSLKEAQKRLRDRTEVSVKSAFIIYLNNIYPVSESALPSSLPCQSCPAVSSTWERSVNDILLHFRNH